MGDGNVRIGPKCQQASLARPPLFLALTLVGLGLTGVSQTAERQPLPVRRPSTASSQARTEVQAATGVDVEEGYTVLVGCPPREPRVGNAGEGQPVVRLLRQRPRWCRSPTRVDGLPR